MNILKGWFENHPDGSGELFLDAMIRRQELVLVVAIVGVVLLFILVVRLPGRRRDYRDLRTGAQPGAPRQPNTRAGPP